jgi:outer membrane protein assembly factor BamE (lipoprotein component of BamABCDE complex)
LSAISRNMATTSLVVLALLITPACSRMRGHQGYIVDSALVDAIQPGIDNRDSVEKTLGRPTFISQFGEKDWYYIARDTRQLAFATPKAVGQLALRVHFDAGGNVTQVDRKGLETAATVKPEKDKTPTLGRDRSFLEDLFGNIGSVGSVSQGGGTADNPQ